MKLFSVFAIFLLVGLVSGEGYWDIQLSPQSVASVPYGSGHVSVWRHANDVSRFYATPLVYLLHESARVRTNVLTQAVELSFNVLLFSEEAKEAVYLYLKRELNSSIARSDVEMLPMEKLRITWKDNMRPVSERYRLVENWKSNTHLPPVVRFQFVCASREFCDELMVAMKEFPEDFNGLEMEYVINGQRSARRSLSVTGRHIVQGRLLTKMTTMTGAGDTRYLTADDLKTVTSESVSNVLGSLVTDSDYVDTGDEVNMNDVLQRELTRHQVSTNNFRPQQWSSVFWNPSWARPDKLTRYLNQVLEKDESDSRSLLLNEQAGSESSGGGGGVGFFELFSISGSGGSSSNSQSKIQKENFLRTLRERHSNVEWTGEQFRVKPMKLYRLNLSTLNTSNNVATANVQVRRYESVHAIKLRVSVESLRSQTPSVTPQLVESRLLQLLNETKSELIQTKSELNQTKSELNQTKSELNQAKSDITDVNDKLQTQNTRLMSMDNEGKARLVPIQRKLDTLPGWPAGKYCILRKGGNCPPGFEYHYVSVWDFQAGSFSSDENLGDSRLRERSNGMADIELRGCCR